MKNNVEVKTKRIIDRRLILKIIVEASFIIISMGAGFLVAYFGNGASYLENEMITAIITLLGFSLTSTVFICQLLKNREDSKVDNVIKALAKNLIVTFILVLISLLFDFLSNTGNENIFALVMLSLKYSALIYAFLIQMDILFAFITIVKKIKP